MKRFGRSERPDAVRGKIVDQGAGFPARLGDISGENEQKALLASLVERPLPNGYTPQARRIKGLTQRETLKPVNDYPASVPVGSSFNFQKAHVLERVAYAPTGEYAFRDLPHGRFSDLPKTRTGPWRHGGNPNTWHYQEAVIVQRVATLALGKFVTIAPGVNAVLDGQFFPHAIYTFDHEGNAVVHTYEDLSSSSTSTRASDRKPEPITGERFRDFAVHLTRLLDPECYTPGSPERREPPAKIEPDGSFRFFNPYESDHGATIVWQPLQPGETSA